MPAPEAAGGGHRPLPPHPGPILPGLLCGRRSAGKSVSCRSWQEAKIRLDQIKARTYLRFKAEHADEKVTVKELEAMVDADEAIYAQALSMISHESEYRKNQANVNAFIEALNSAKMLCKIDLREYQTQGG